MKNRRFIINCAPIILCNYLQKEKKMEKNNNIKNIYINIDKKISVRPEYKKMLNNLLSIGARDNTVFSSSKARNFDLFPIVSKLDYEKIFTQNTFSINVSAKNDIELIDELLGAKNFDEFIEVIDLNSINVSISDRRLLEKKFDENKIKLLEKIKKQNNQVIQKWKKIRNSYLDIHAQTNSWPLYVGTMFVKVRTARTVLYAPLILRKVKIDIANKSKVIINSVDSAVDINEKLLFLLQNEYKFELPKLVDDDLSFKDVIKQFSSSLENIVDPKFQFKGKFGFLTKNDVGNKDIEYAKGAILTFASPSGGELRNKLIELINNDGIDELLSVDPMKNIKNEVDILIKDHRNFFRIQRTDLSQDKAILGSMMDSSIIWGPPGTGKSQTLANIIANLLFENKSVVITSEKKVALDVIKDRMGILSKYIYFGLIDKNINKVEFYKPFVELIGKITKASADDFIPYHDAYRSINESELLYFKQKEDIANEDIDSLTNLYARFKNDDSIKKWFNEENNLIIENSNFFQNLSKYRNIYDAMMGEGVNKKGLVFKKYPEDITLVNKMMEDNITIKDIRSFSKLKDKNNYFNFKDKLDIEENFKKSKSEFENDIDYIDNALAIKFKSKFDDLSKSHKYGKKFENFMKDCYSGFRTPFKFVELYNDIIIKLFNVFASTPQTLSSIIDMDRRYDFVIFDEASQLHIEKALPFISIADKAIIAGDKEQMRPSSFFSVRDNSDIEEESEEDVDSLLDYAYRKGLGIGREYMLNKNYRSSYSELMLFSSREFYESNLDVIDSIKKQEKSIVVHEVKGKWEGRANNVEATKILDETLNNLDGYESIIILTLNSNQKEFIESLIYSEEKYRDILDLLSEEKIKLRNLENIQGDEADLVLISVAYDEKARLGSTYIARPEGRNALNVAVSRAKEKMIIFKSLKANQVEKSQKNKSINTFKSWLEYLELSSEERKNNFISLNNEDSKIPEFKEKVFNNIRDYLELENKFIIEKQYSIGSYKIDIALIRKKDKKFMLGIEVDGYKYNLSFGEITKNIERQRFLESKNYPFYKVTELNWKANKRTELLKIAEFIGL